MVRQGNIRGTLDLYASHGPITDPKEYGHLFDDAPETIQELVEVVQGLMLHIFWAERYGVTPNEQQREHVQARTMHSILGRIRTIDDRSLTQKRSLENRFFGNCRDHSVLLCAVLRAKGIPARARCGFGTYFIPGHFEDHWVCEYWDEQQERWVTVDPQLDDLQQKALGISFDPLDMPKGQFITGAEGWKMVREGKENPENFGIFDMHGLWFIRGNFLRDLAALNKVELLPWDSWGLISAQDQELTPGDYECLDQVADMVVSEDPELYRAYQENEGLKVPEVITSWVEGQPMQISWSASS